jgi:hypothetical protein
VRRGWTEQKGFEQLHLSNKKITVHSLKKSANQRGVEAPTGLHLAPPVFSIEVVSRPQFWPVCGGAGK